ncbi:hypothetical protein EOD42_22540 [Rhodovarius crocodyli]|uniref:Uncharacterized protein n=1 Tax=Rhodovarius crocodyli TaxID=1979269 RepID=A0A437M188_9PROT|nr:hypothetical protein [Rhodovarius crocodyli]RVT91437.1 hypothetical protein EOD42_22540 [Rhodovarius crocodyli]
MSTARPISFAPRPLRESFETEQLLQAEKEMLNAVFEAALHADQCPGLPPAIVSMMERLRRISGSAIEELCAGVHELALLADMTPTLPRTFARHVDALRDHRVAVFEAQRAMPEHGEGDREDDEDPDDDWGDEVEEAVPVRCRRPIWNTDMAKAPRDGRTVWVAFQGGLVADPRRTDLALWSDRQVPVVHAGLDAEGNDLGWTLAMPVSAGTFPSFAFRAWRWPSCAPAVPLIPKI